MSKVLIFVSSLVFSGLFIIFNASAETSQSTLKLVVPGSSENQKIRNPFVDELLKLIAHQQNLALDIEYFAQPLQQKRALRALSENKSINLTWSMTTKEREKDLLAVKIPIYKGLIGWRVALIHPKAQGKFEQTDTLEELRQLVAVQRFDWPDYSIFMANDLKVEGDFSLDQMSKAVETGLADYFPRSVLEIGRETLYQRNKNLAVDNSIIIKYPTAYYFFVNKNSPQLANTITEGFEKAIQDGSFDRLFNKHFSHLLSDLKIDKRHVIKLHNPLIFEKDLPSDKKYWLN